MYGFKLVGASDDVALFAICVPVLGLYVWNRQSDRDLFNGMALPTLVLMFFISLMGVAIEESGAFFEIVHAIGLLGALFGVLWVMSLLLTLWGPKTGPFS